MNEEINISLPLKAVKDSDAHRLFKQLIKGLESGLYERTGLELREDKDYGDCPTYELIIDFRIPPWRLAGVVVDKTKETE